MDSIKTRVLCMSYKEMCLNEICREPFIQSQDSFQSRRNFAVGGGFIFVLRIGFYEYISWESRCNSEIKVWTHFDKIKFWGITHQLWY